ncbi:hypothetical protein ABB37_06398 [Leptomonas pyrrhocoris]|uniref:Uncharacterized protein n=1 Tax=Leptomonas pyrrhocoris TaxID=157538 RepID=A0A0N0VEF5_LEPPY|nr:hypothetical protein ABB37_06398 [Leptomonas pyrrhocoris]KPA78244.1 hypothetical protein ABB37_06398 [Leptomonas pyrrhocoris]|eukprot:XP_015656683.1 hypothetical protein ABB37_06398 [Leptomonas pyrrhocoris]
MPAKSSKRNVAVASEEGEGETNRAVAPRHRLEYRRPWNIFYPVAAMFLLLNYLAFGTTTDESGTTRLLPEYVAAGKASSRSAIFTALLFFEERVMGFLFQLGLRWFQSLFGIQVVCIVGWLIHFFELGMCTRICISCNATPGTTALYMLCTTMAGFAQLVPLTAARNAWVSKTKSAGEAASGPAAQGSKKKK